MGCELAPKGKTCRLVSTVKRDHDVIITLLDRSDGFVTFLLSELASQKDAIQLYLEPLIDAIHAGQFQTKLLPVTYDDFCC